MTRVFDNPAQFMDDMLEGFCALHSNYVTPVPGGVVRARESAPGKVAVIVGGGSGHYPAFCGVVGPGFADGAIVGNVFTSPSAQDAINVGAAADNGGGVILTAGNYAGDVLHFNEAAETLTREGINAKTLFVTDDVASAPRGEEAKRRGIAGDFVVFKVMSAAAEAGYDLDAVLQVGHKANDATRTMGVAFAGCTLPGQTEPLFTVPKGKMGIGLGIHGEPGISEEAVPTAEELAQLLVDHVLDELELEPGSQVGAILNGLGGTKYEELFVVWRHVDRLLGEKGLHIVHPEVGELVTSLDMAGLSLTVVALDEELEGFWTASADSPAFKKGSVSASEQAPERRIKTLSKKNTTGHGVASEVSQGQARKVLEMLSEMEQVLRDAEEELGRIDAVAGDGDHGRGMLKGILAAREAAEEAVSNTAGVETTFELAGEAWAAKAGGTSGALWGAALKNIGRTIGDRPEGLGSAGVREAMQAGFDTIGQVGKASLGDKTMLDSLGPFVTALGAELDKGNPLSEAWNTAAQHASDAAQATADLTPKIGRARPLAERSVGTPDAGAISMAMILSALGKFFR